MDGENGKAGNPADNKATNADARETDSSRRRFLAGGAAGLTGLALAGGFAAPAASAAASGRYRDSVVLIAGSTSGIGEATAHAYAREGASVVVCGRRQERGDAVVTAIREAGGEATFVPADVREPVQVRHLVERTVETYGRLDIAFNNAGIEGPRGRVRRDRYRRRRRLSRRDANQCGWCLLRYALSDSGDQRLAGCCRRPRLSEYEVQPVAAG